ncbi:SMP-30/gluconolactonase/LRE family protein [soil metagenome]
MTSGDAEVALDAGALLAESPVWDGREGVLRWVDIPRGEVHRYDPSGGLDTHSAFGEPVGAVALREGGGLLLAVGRGFATVEQDGDALSWLWRAGRGDRMNDGKCDPAGRFWAGTMADERHPGGASLYRLDPDGHVEEALPAVTLSNGLGWSPSGETLYYVDTPLERVDAFDYDLSAGTISRRRTLVDLRAADGRPDGLTVDADGGLWVAMAHGGAVRRYTSDGVLDHVLTLPVPMVTSCTFGGPELADLYITTASEEARHPGAVDHPHAGAVFRAALGVTGLPATPYRG